MKIKIILLMLIAFALFGNDSLELDYCKNMVYKNFPTNSSKTLLEKISSLKQNNFLFGYLPQASLQAQASYQSDVTKFPLKFPPQLRVESPETPTKDKYQFLLEIKQIIYDGGYINGQIKLEKSSILVDSMKLEAELYKLNDLVNNLFFSLLSLEEKINMLLISKNDLESKLSQLESAVKNGIILQTNLDILSAEILNLEAQIEEAILLKNTNIDILSDLMKTKIDYNTKIVRPKIENFDNNCKRPELTLFELEKKKLDNSSFIINSKIIPKLYLFAQAGYSKPALNMFDDNFDKYGIVGVKAQFDITNLYTYKNEKEVLKISKNLIDKQKESFLENLDVSLKKTLSEIENISGLIEKDEKIIKIRESILKRASIQLDNGTISTTEYVNYSNTLNLSRQTMKMHEIQLLFAKINYKNLLNN